MRLNKIFSQTLAWFCLVQMCLLSLASFSPQIHAWIFHGEHLTDINCSDSQSLCSELPNSSKDHTPEPEDSDKLCAVILFAQGVIFIHNLIQTEPRRHAAIESITIESDTIRTDYFQVVVQARAPPIA